MRSAFSWDSLSALPGAAERAPAGSLPPRAASLDAWRGFVMFLLLAEALHLWTIVRIYPESGFAKALAFHTTHVAWVGCSLHDMIQPAFSFLVGAAMVFSLARRREEQGFGRMLGHALWRALVLVLLGVWLRSTGSRMTHWTFEDTLTQIGLGYPLLFLVAWLRPAAQVAAFAVVVTGYWVAFAVYPLPPDGFDYGAVGAPAGWEAGTAEQVRTGFQAHWNLNSNAAWAFDRWFLNLFPRERPFEFNGGGYSTLSFLPTLGTMILGLLAGGLLRAEAPAARKLLWFLAAGAAGIAAGLAAGALGICPVVKRIWTPSWTLYSGGICFVMLAAFHLLADMWKLRFLLFPLTVIGMNSITAYLLHSLTTGFLEADLRRHFPGLVNRAGAEWAPVLTGAGVVLIQFGILLWMYRKRIFLRI